MEVWKSKDERVGFEPLLLMGLKPSAFHLSRLTPTPKSVEQEHGHTARHINQTVVDRRGTRRHKALMVFVRERVDDDYCESDEEPATTELAF